MPDAVLSQIEAQLTDVGDDDVDFVDFDDAGVGAPRT